MVGIWDKPQGYFILIRFTKQKYARAMLHNGSIRFGTPEEWVNAAKEPGGRGDKREGTLGAYSLFTRRPFSLKPYENDGELIHVKDGNYIYVKNRRHMNLPTICFYSVMDYRNDPNASQELIIDGKMFTDFTKNSSAQIIEQTSEEEEPAVVIIEDHRLFLELLKKKLLQLGVHEDEIIFSEVKYEDMSKGGQISGYRPLMELFCKDVSYSYQREMRIVINTKSHDVLNMLREPIYLGNLDKVITVHDWYFEKGIKVEINPGELT